MREACRVLSHKVGEMTPRHVGQRGKRIFTLPCRQQYLAICVLTSHQCLLTIPPKLARYARAGNAEGIPTDKKPNRTCMTDISKRSGNPVIEPLHSVGISRKHVDDQFLVLSFPFSHFRVCIDNRPDVVNYVLPLSALFLKGNRSKG